MTKLTLPIQIGKKYHRRDGVVVEATLPYQDYDPTKFAWSKPGDARDEDDGHVWLSTGRIRSSGIAIDFPTDLIADAEEQTDTQVQEKPEGHPHAALMLLYAQDAAETAEPWERWECFGSMREWMGINSHPNWGLSNQYRRKPKTIRIGDFDVPEPERVAPRAGVEYFVAAPAHDDFFVLVRWRGNDIDKRFLSRRFIHLTPEAAELHAKALISLIEKK